MGKIRIDQGGEETLARVEGAVDTYGRYARRKVETLIDLWGMIQKEDD